MEDCKSNDKEGAARRKKFAFLLMGAYYNPDLHKAVFETERGLFRVFTVRSLGEAQELVPELDAQEFGAIVRESVGRFPPGSRTAGGFCRKSRFARRMFVLLKFLKNI